MASNPIDCIKLHTKYLSTDENISREAATDLALKEFEKLHGELETFKKLINPKYTKQAYVSPDKSARIKEIQDEYQAKIDEANTPTSEPTKVPVTKSEGEVEGGAKVGDYSGAKKELDAVKEKHSKFLRKDGGLRANTPEAVKKEIVDAYEKLQVLVKQERDNLVSNDKRDTGLVDGIDRIKDNADAMSLVKRVMDRGMIPERQYNDFGKNLLHIVSDKNDKHEVVMQTAEIIQDFISRANIKADNTLARELQAAENLKFELTENETNQEPTKDIKPEQAESQPQPEKTIVEDKQGAKTKQQELAEKVRSLKINLSKLSGGGLQSNPLGLPVAVWNSAMDIVAKTIEVGGDVADAIQKGLKYIQKNHRGQWDKKGFNDQVMKELGVKGITVNGEDLIVKSDTKTEREYAKTVNGWYSDLEQSVLDVKGEQGRGENWIKVLGKSDEAKWTGLNDWLSQQKGKVSKADIQNYLKDNRIDIVEVAKSDRPFKEIKNKMFSLGNEWEEVYGGVEAKKSNKDGDRFNLRINGVEFQRDFSYPDAKDYIEANATENPEKSRSKFSQYQTEGEKSNYKEVLVTMPQKTEKANYEVVKKGDLYYPTDKVRNIPTSPYSTFEQAKAESDRLNKGAVERTSKDTFKSSHFDEPNILVHLRMNTRTDSEGNKVLFLEEVQSDWGQKGKKEGFKTGKEKDIYDIAQAIYYVRKSDADADLKKTSLANIKKKADEKGVTEKEIQNAFELYGDFTSIPKTYEGAPTAPFVTDTNSWTKLGLKVALKEAVKQGAEKIAWTTGEQQNDRYDLSKQVDRIDVEKVEGQDNLFFVDITMPNGEVNYLEVENGKVRNDKSTYQGQRLEDLIGKDMAEKILTGESQTIKGEGLKVGGKGMKGFYGSPTEKSLGIVGNVAKSLFKQEPKTVSIETGIRSRMDKYEVVKRENGKYALRDIEEDIIITNQDNMDGFATKADANEYAKEYFGEYPETSTQHSIDITPELKAEVEGGLPLFKDIKGRGKEIADLLRKGKIKLGGLQSNIAGLPIAVYNGAIEVIARALEGGATLTQAINRAYQKLKIKEKHKNFNQDEFIKKLEEATGEKFEDSEGSGKEPPIEPPKKEGVEGEGNLSGIKKGLVSEEVIKGVDLERISDKQMMSLGRKILDTGEVKPEALVTKIITEGKGVLTPTEVVGLITYKRDIDNSVQDAYKKYNEKLNAGDDTGTLGVEIANLERQINDFDVMAIITAQQQSMAFRLRQRMLDREYNVVTQIERYKKNNSGYIPPEVEAKFRDLDKQLKEVKAKLAEAEKKAEQKEGQESVDNIKESVDREKKYTDEEIDKKVQQGVDSELNKIYEQLPAEKKRAGDKAIAALQKFRAKLKNKTYESTLGIPVAIADLGAVTAIRAIKVGRTIAEAVEMGINRIKKALKEKGFDKWGKEADYRKDLTETLEADGVSLKQVKDKPIINEDGTVKIPNQMLRDLVSRGLTEIEELTTAVHKEVVKDFPDVTERQVRDYITDYGKEVNPTADQLQQQVNTAKRVGRLLSELEDVQSKIKKVSNPANKVKLTDRERELKRKINSLKKDTFSKDEKTPEQQLFDAKERTKTSIDELNRKIKNKDFAKPVKKTKPTDTELKDLEHKKELLQEEFDKEQYKLELKNRKWWQKAEDIALEIFTGISRTLVAGVDLSAGLVQGVWRWFRDPKMSARATGEMFRQFASEKRNAEWFSKLKASGSYEKIKQSKLAVTDEQGRASVKEGLFIVNWANKIYDGLAYLITGGYKPATNFVRKVNPIKASQRAFDGYVNYIRVAKYLDLVRIAEKDGYTIEADPKIFEKLADHVNTTTGRGSMGALETSSKWLSVAMFAPRKVISEIKLFTPYAFLYYAKMPKYVRQKALLDFAKFAASYVSVNTAIWAASQVLQGKGFDDDDDHFWDITSSQFFTHRFGNTRLNIGGGMKSALVFQGRLYSGVFTDQYGKSTKLGDRFGKQVNTRLDLGLRYLMGKASPGMGATIKKLDEKKGLEVDDESLMKDLIIPMWMQDAKELYKEHPSEIGTLFNILSIFGANVRTVEPKKQGKSITIKDPETFKKRDVTEKEQKKYEETKEKGYNTLISDYERGKQTIWVDVNDDINIPNEDNFDKGKPKNLTVEEFDTWKEIKYSKLTPEQKKQLEGKAKRRSSAEAKKELFGVDEDE